jgi:hypothetical protein
MKNRALTLVASLLAAIGLATVGFAAGYLTAQQNTQLALPTEIVDQPNQNCFLGPEMEEMSNWNDSQLVACQVTGMSQSAAEAYAEAAGVTVRIAYEDGEYFALTEDFRGDRINIYLHAGVIIRADAW